MGNVIVIRSARGFAPAVVLLLVSPAAHPGHPLPRRVRVALVVAPAGHAEAAGAGGEAEARGRSNAVRAAPSVPRRAAVDAPAPPAPASPLPASPAVVPRVDAPASLVAVTPQPAAPPPATLALPVAPLPDGVRVACVCRPRRTRRPDHNLRRALGPPARRRAARIVEAHRLGRAHEENVRLRRVDLHGTADRPRVRGGVERAPAGRLETGAKPKVRAV